MANSPLCDADVRPVTRFSQMGMGVATGDGCFLKL